MVRRLTRHARRAPALESHTRRLGRVGVEVDLRRLGGRPAAGPGVSRPRAAPAARAADGPAAAVRRQELEAVFVGPIQLQTPSCCIQVLAVTHECTNGVESLAGL